MSPCLTGSEVPAPNWPHTEASATEGPRLGDTEAASGGPGAPPSSRALDSIHFAFLWKMRMEVGNIQTPSSLDAREVIVTGLTDHPHTHRQTAGLSQSRTPPVLTVAPLVGCGLPTAPSCSCEPAPAHGSSHLPGPPVQFSTPWFP